MRTTEERLKHLRVVAEHLVPYTFPKCSQAEDLEILPLKTIQVAIDGYECMVCLSRSEYEDVITETLQIQSVYTPYLPFVVVYKIVKTVFPNRQLIFTEFHREPNKKVYCWFVRYDKNGSPLAPAAVPRSGVYEDLNYKIIDSETSILSPPNE